MPLTSSLQGTLDRLMKDCLKIPLTTRDPIAYLKQHFPPSYVYDPLQARSPEEQLRDRALEEMTHSRHGAVAFVDAAGETLIGLNLCGCPITDSQWQAALPLLGDQLQALSLAETEISELLLDARFERLVQLELSRNTHLSSLRFEAVPSQLQVLDAYDCRLPSLTLPKGLDALRRLDLSRNQDLADCLFKGGCPQLHWLDLSNNALTELHLPRGFDQLAYLFAHDNQLRSLSYSSAKDLPALRKLHLRNNQLTQLPPNPLELTSLETLFVHGNALEDIPATSIHEDERSSSWAAIRGFLLSKQQDGAEENDEVKLILLGNSTAGKSSLLYYLQHKAFPEDMSSTHGIVNFVWQPERENYKVNVWDFGGQEFYHATHRLFLTDNAVALVLFEAATNKQAQLPTQLYVYEEGKRTQKQVNLWHYPHGYWLSGLAHFCQEMPTVGLVESKIDLREDRKEPPIDINSDEKATFQLTDEDIFRLSILKASKGERKYHRRFEDFEDRLFELLAETRSSYDISSKWLEIKAALRKLAKDSAQAYLTWADYEAFCEGIRPGIAALQAGSESLRLIDPLTDYLHKIGVILYYRDIPSLADTVFISPEWVIDTIYKVLDYQVMQNEGEFHLAHVAQVVSDISPAQVISLMTEFELIFPLALSAETFVAPQYLPESDAAFQAEKGYKKQVKDRQELMFVLNFPHFLPRSVMTRFICKYGSLAEDYFWKHGILFTKHLTDIWVEETADRQIVVKANQANEGIASELFTAFRTINDRNPAVQVSIDGEQFVEVEQLAHALKTESGFRQRKDNQIQTVAGTFVDVGPYLALFGLGLAEGGKHRSIAIDIDQSIHSPTIPNPSSMNHIQQLIGQNRVPEAIAALEKILPAAQMQALISLRRRWRDLSEHEMLNTKSADWISVEKNSIVSALLSLAQIDETDGGQKPAPEPAPAPKAPVSTTRQILFLAANPIDAGRIQTDKEHRILKAELARGAASSQYHFLPSQFAVTITELLRALEGRPEIVHFSGHGDRDGILITTDDHRIQPLPTGVLRRNFRRLVGSTELVILNACLSSGQAQVISELGILVIGHNISVQDPVAISFSKGFYLALGLGKTYLQAYEYGLDVAETEHPQAGPLDEQIEVWQNGQRHTPS